MDPVISKCKQLLQQHYADHFAGLILYGSQTRESEDTESDIDLLVLLDRPFNYFQEIWRLTELLYPLQLETDRLLSVKPAALQDFQGGTIQLYRNARRNGKPV